MSKKTNEVRLTVRGYRHELDALRSTIGLPERVGAALKTIIEAHLYHRHPLRANDVDLMREIHKHVGDGIMLLDGSVCHLLEVMVVQVGASIAEGTSYFALVVKYPEGILKRLSEFASSTGPHHLFRHGP